MEQNQCLPCGTGVLIDPICDVVEQQPGIMDVELINLQHLHNAIFNYGQTSLMNVSSTLVNLYHEELMRFKGGKKDLT